MQSQFVNRKGQPVLKQKEAALKLPRPLNVFFAVIPNQELPFLRMACL